MAWGKILGALLGYWIASKMGIGLIGLLLGLYFGHKIDKFRARFSGLRAGINQSIFFHATFAVMGHLAKAKGQVTESEIQLASALMDQMRLQGEIRTRAQNAFRDGKSADFPLQATLLNVKRACLGRNDLLQMFIEVQIQAAFADGDIHPNEREVLYTIAEVFGFSQAQLDQRLSMQDGAYQFNQHGGWDPQMAEKRLKDAFKVLGIEEDADTKTIKRAYRKLMNEHHPDKLAASGLPVEMMEMAKQKAQEIQAAYEEIKRQKGLK